MPPQCYVQLADSSDLSVLRIRSIIYVTVTSVDKNPSAPPVPLWAIDPPRSGPNIEYFMFSLPVNAT